MSKAFEPVIAGIQVVTGQGVFPVTLAIREGRIGGVPAPIERPPAAKTILAHFFSTALPVQKI